jgi:hypothetical protein
MTESKEFSAYCSLRNYGAAINQDSETAQNAFFDLSATPEARFLGRVNQLAICLKDSFIEQYMRYKTLPRRGTAEHKT